MIKDDRKLLGELCGPVALESQEHGAEQAGGGGVEREEGHTGGCGQSLMGRLDPCTFLMEFVLSERVCL